MNQVRSGKGFEYGIAFQLQEIAQAKLVNSVHLETAERYFSKCDKKEQKKIMGSAKEIVIFLTRHETRIKQQSCSVKIQSDQEGARGDVRDVIIDTPDGEVGISAKNRHFAVKNPRLSERIDFGKKWLGYKVSQPYWDAVVPIFREMRNRKKNNQLWREIDNKEGRFYSPILSAFNIELQHIYDADKKNVPKKLLHYLLGYYDFYKVAKINGKAVVQSFNINGTLRWGRRLPMPTTIENYRDTTATTTLYTFDRGWQISFRIHNAESKVTPSLKFDVQLVGLPHVLSTHEIEYFFDG